ncbi:MAG TPA: WbqC family protein [Chitinophagales bacterium]|nr:WbqC family protein [Chitinophagales bacterium]
MNAILIESQYIGSCSYWNLLLKADAIVLDTHEHFVKRSYRNRAHILGANGLLRLSIPLVSGKHQHSAMKDVRISYNENWQGLHWHSFTSAYRRSPFFEFYEDHFRKFYEEKTDLLVEYNFQLMQTIAFVLKTELSVSFSDKYFTKDEFSGTDYRSHVMPGKDNTLDFTAYPQVFSDRFPFEKDLSILDLLFNTGTRAKEYIEQIKLR